MANGGNGGQRLSRLTIGSGSPGVVGLASAINATNVSFVVDGVDESDVRQITLVNVDSRESFRTTMRRGRGGGEDDDEDEGASGPQTLSAPPGHYEIYLNGSRGLYLSGLTATGAKVAGERSSSPAGPRSWWLRGRSGRVRLTA